MYEPLAIAIIVASLLVAGWCFVAAGRDRWIGTSHVVGLVALQAGIIAQAVVAVVRIAGGDRPEQFVTFLGYLITSVIMLPLAGLLASMERTRWGAVIAGAGAAVTAVLVVRLQQVWIPLR